MHGRRGFGVRSSGTIINARGRAGIGLGTTIEYQQFTATQLPEHRATHNGQLPCHCSHKTDKPSLERCVFVPSVSQRRRCLSLSSTSALRASAGTEQLLFVLEGRFVLWATTLKFCRQQRDSTADISSLMFFKVGSLPSPPSLSPPPP